MLMIVLINTGYADDSYTEIKALEKSALEQVENYKSEASKHVADVDKEIRFTLNKNDFFKQQREKLKIAFKAQGKPNSSAEVLVFVSFSMPRGALKSLLRESAQYNATVIIQGLVENSLSKTLVKTNELIADLRSNGGVQIDPNLFNDYKITKVPAIAVGDSANFDIVYGLASIKEALQIFKNKNGAQASKAARLLNDE